MNLLQPSPEQRSFRHPRYFESHPKLSIWQRAKWQVSLGDADNPVLLERILRHGNFVEPVPLTRLIGVVYLLQDAVSAQNIF